MKEWGEYASIVYLSEMASIPWLCKKFPNTLTGIPLPHHRINSNAMLELLYTLWRLV